MENDAGTEAKQGVLADLKEKILGIDKKQLFILLLIFLLAFGVRAYMMKFELLFGFDSYWHARMVGLVIETGIEPAQDPLAYYQLENPAINSPSPVFWYVSAFLYKIFTLGSPYDKDVWMLFVKILPAFYGALICVAVFFLFKEMYSRKAGYAAAFFAAVSASYVYRTMASFFEEDSLGFLWLVIGFYFFVKAVKPGVLDKNSLKNSILAGIFFGILAWTWGMFLIVPFVLSAYIIIMLGIMWFRGIEKQKMVAVGALFLISFSLFAVIATIHDNGAWTNSMTGYFVNYIPVTAENIERAQSKGPGILQQTIGEENLGSLFWAMKYNILIIFPFLAVLLLIYRVIRVKEDRVSLILLFWVLITLYMAWNKLKFTYVLGLPIAASAGFVFHEAFYLIRNRPSFEKKTTGLLLAFMLLAGVGSASLFVIEHFPNIEQNNGWKPALNWMKENTPKDAKFFNWWDEGHWITFVGERAVIEDNRNYDFDADRNYAKFCILEDENAAYDIVKGYYSDYVIMGSDTLVKLGSMQIYAYNTLQLTSEMKQYFGVELPCSKSVDSLTQQETYHCGQNTFPKEVFEQTPSTWTNIPNHLEQERIPMFIYRNPENNRLFFINAETNNSMAAKLWFNHPGITKFSEVYSSGGVKIFKVE